MAYSSIVGADNAPTHPSGRESELLGPSDNSDSGSDTVGTTEAHEDSDAAGTGERGVVAGRDSREGSDILPDRVVNLASEEESEADLDSTELTDLTDLDDEEVRAIAEGDAPGDER
ncbi:hypothetical protein WG902_21440 [Ramlibacter sp. PS3R-8]|uniref:hypothetical protein n=1 Tax=Ramlibacter sp. PS3R-8 TaxID=3133437 RepID=UPI00309C6AB4